MTDRVAATVADDLTDELRLLGTVERAVAERAYLKSDLEFLGVSIPAIRRVAKSVRARYAADEHDALVSLVSVLWSVPIHERRMLAVELLTIHKGALGLDDLVLLERLLRESLTWALVDSLAASVVGSIVEAHPEAASTLDHWVADDDFWLRRSAMLALLLPLRRGDGDPGRFFSYADRLLDEKEFFIRKAIGWILRDMGRKRPELVLEWVRPRVDRMSGVTLTEALKCLQPSDVAVLREAHRSRGRG
ncbi:MAG: DNA alkylation repair protein [Acidimicrobiales bacterium]|jgi:3-methyladenine DNA glycosylase AlkD